MRLWVVYFLGLAIGFLFGFGLDGRVFMSFQPIEWSKVENAYKICGNGSGVLQLKMAGYWGDGRGDNKDKYVVGWLRDIANDIDAQGWSARSNAYGSCSVYAGPRVNGVIPARPLEGDEIRKLRDLNRSIKVEPEKRSSLSIDFIYPGYTVPIMKPPAVGTILCADASGNVVPC